MTHVVQKKKVFWGWEGISERNFGGYLQIIANELGIPLHFDREHNLIGGGDPLTIVEQSVRVMLQSEKRRGKYKYRIVLMDADRIRDDENRFVAAQELCRTHRIDLFLQCDTHEAMLVRMHKPHRRTRLTKNQAARTLVKIWPNYEKPMNAQQLFARFGCGPLDFISEAEPDLYNFFQKIGLPCR